MTFSEPVVIGHTFNSSDMEMRQAASSYLAASPDVRNVTGPTMPYGAPLAYNSINYSTSPGRQLFSGSCSQWARTTGQSF